MAPLEVFVYDWWPIRAEVRLLERLSTMPVRIEYQETASGGAWRSDWPAVPAADPGFAGSGQRRRRTCQESDDAVDSFRSNRYAAQRHEYHYPTNASAF